MHSRPVIEKVYLHGVVVKQGKACYRLSFRRPAKKVLIDHWLLLTFRLFLPIIVPHQRPTAKGEVFTLARSSGRISAEGWHRAAGCFGTAETDGHSPSRPSKGRFSLRPALPLFYSLLCHTAVEPQGRGQPVAFTGSPISEEKVVPFPANRRLTVVFRMYSITLGLKPVV